MKCPFAPVQTLVPAFQKIAEQRPSPDNEARWSHNKTHGSALGTVEIYDNQHKSVELPPAMRGPAVYPALAHATSAGALSTGSDGAGDIHALSLQIWPPNEALPWNISAVDLLNGIPSPIKTADEFGNVIVRSQQGLEGKARLLAWGIREEGLHFAQSLRELSIQTSRHAGAGILQSHFRTLMQVNLGTREGRPVVGEFCLKPLTVQPGAGPDWTRDNGLGEDFASQLHAGPVQFELGYATIDREAFDAQEAMHRGYAALLNPDWRPMGRLTLLAQPVALHTKPVPADMVWGSERYMTDYPSLAQKIAFFGSRGRFGPEYFPVGARGHGGFYDDRSLVYPHSQTARAAMMDPNSYRQSLKTDLSKELAHLNAAQVLSPSNAQLQKALAQYLPL